MTNRIRLLRPDDLLCLEIEPINLELQNNADSGWGLQRTIPEQPAFIIVHFPPQALAEEAFMKGEFGNNNTPEPFEHEKVNSKNNKPCPDSPPPSNTPDVNINNINFGDKLIGIVKHSITEGGLLKLELAYKNKEPIAQSILSGPSRLVFKLPDDPSYTIPYTIEGLLNWQDFTLVVTPVAALALSPSQQAIDQAGSTRAPQPTETAIEFPYRLIISPNNLVQWAHAKQPITHDGITELWHTRLLKPINEQELTNLKELSAKNKAPFRAVWSPDFEFKERDFSDILNDTPPKPKSGMGVEHPFRMSMNAYDRFSIVLNTTAFSNYVTENSIFPYKPEPFYAEQFILSPLGAYMRSRGNWELPYYLQRPKKEKPFFIEELKSNKKIAPLLQKSITNFIKIQEHHIDDNSIPIIIKAGERAKDSTTSLSEWVHRASLGRDHYVRIVYEGFLYPFGHRAALIKVTERKIGPISNNNTNKKLYAYLEQRMFIVVREPVKDYTKLDGHINTGLNTDFVRHFPFKNIKLTTLVTPDISNDASVKIGDFCKGDFAIWIQNTKNEDIKFNAIAQDYNNQYIDFAATLIFVAADKVEATKSKVVATYGKEKQSRKVCIINGQKINFVPAETNSQQQNTNLETLELQFHACEFINNKPNYKGFAPILHTAKVNLASLESVIGQRKQVTIKFNDDYLLNGLTNAGKVFAGLVKYEGDTKTDGSAANLPKLLPQIEPATFAAKQAGGVATPNFDVSCLSQTQGTAGGKIQDAAANNFSPADFFNGLDTKLFGTIDLKDIVLAGISTQAPIITRNAGGEIKLVWQPKLQGNQNFVLLKFNVTPDVTTLLIQTTINRATANNQANNEVTGSLQNFQLVFIGAIEINFKQFKFVAKNGQKPDFDVQLTDETPLQFIDDLAFVEDLRKIIPKGLFGKGASLDLSPTGIRAGFSFAVPPVAIGVFALKDVTLAAYLSLPFTTGKPTFDFAVSERHKPFAVLVAFFGGGGFFHVQLDTNGLQLLEASIEFGAAISINLGVASGGVYVMAGIYYAYKNKKSSLTGYFRCGGEVSVLGIVSISIEFYISFTYTEEGKCSGKASLTISIEILFFSFSKTLTVERGFGGQSGDPVFKQVMPTHNYWESYALAFA